MTERSGRSVAIILSLGFLLFSGFLFLVGVSLMGGQSDGLITEAFDGDNRVAMVRIEGPIMGSEDVVDEIEKWAEDESVKAIILRIDSPGGLVGPSQEIYQAALRARKKKPVVASLADVAASGGYYIAAAANSIVTNPGSVTGSIGVIMMFDHLYKLMEKIGLGSVVIKSGTFKDTGSPARPITEREKELLQSIVDDLYGQFVADIAKGRNMEIAAVRALADGRIYTGRQAVKNGLADRIGTLHDAVALAGKLGHIKGKPEVVEREEPMTLLRRILGDDFEMSLPFEKIINRTQRPAGFYYLWAPGL